MQEDPGTGGYIAFPVATPSKAPGPGVQRSIDGLNWTVEAPVTVDYGAVIPTSFEFGGTEKMANGRYYLIGGGSGPGPGPKGYGMWTLRSEGSDVAGYNGFDISLTRRSSLTSTVTVFAVPRHVVYIALLDVRADLAESLAVVVSKLGL